jgi:acid phosphatase class B
MKTGLDYWNVCSHHPVVFRELAAALLAAGNEVHVISAIGKSRAGTVAAEVTRLGIPVTAVHEVVFTHPRESPALKTAKCLELGISVFYDDRDDVCRAMTAAGILALRVTRPEPHAGRTFKPGDRDIAAERA